MNADEKSSQRLVKRPLRSSQYQRSSASSSLSAFAVAEPDERGAPWVLAASRRVMPDAEPPDPERDSEEGESERRRQA